MIKVERWIDINSEEYKRCSDPKGGRRLIERGLACKALMVDSEGRIYTNGEEKIPLNDTLDGKLVGFRYPARASN